MTLEMLPLHPTQDFVTPYDYDTENFTERWWNCPLAPETIKDQRKNDYWSFRDEGAEIARAWLDKGTIDDVYVGLKPPEEIVDIAFFEVSRRFRRQGYGTSAVRLLVSHYKGWLLTAFPIDAAADAFWGSTGFTYRPRKDGTDHRGSRDRTHDPLYTLGNR